MADPSKTAASTMAQDTEQTQETEAAAFDLVAIDNRRTSLVVLASTKPGRVPRDAKGKDVIIPHEVEKYTLAPGINFVPSDVVKRTLLPSDLHGEPLAQIDPFETQEYHAKAVIARSKSAAALKTWAQHDPRPGIQAAIAAQLPDARD